MISFLKAIYFFFFLKTKDSLFDQVKSTFRVMPWDLDLYIHLNNAKYLKYMDQARLEHGFKTNLIKAILGKDFNGIIANIEINYLRSLQPFEKFSIHTRLLGWDKKYLYLEQDFYSKQGICATTLVRQAILKQGKTVLIEEVLAKTHLPFVSPKLPESVHHWNAVIQAKKEQSLANTKNSEPDKAA